MAEHRDLAHQSEPVHETAKAGPSAWLKAAQAKQEAPLGTPPGDLYFTYETPEGDTFTNGAALAEEYLKLGYKVTGETTINGSDEWRQKVSPGSALPPASGVEFSEATATPGAMAQPAPKS